MVEKQKTSEVAKVSTASMIGTAIESYDFLVYGTAAAAYFGTAFFPSVSPAVGALASFATLGVGFLGRPLGGYLAGHFGDRIGRKTVLIGSLMVMGVATLPIGLLPTFAQVGILAPILLVIIRLVQGIGYGAEWGGAVLMAVEHSPPHRRGFFGAVPQVGVPAGLLLANGAFLVSQQIFEGDMVWRVPFLLSAVLVIFGLFIRLKISESPEFEEMKAKKEIVKMPVVEAVRRDWRTILRIIGLRLAETGGYYITTSFVLSYVVVNGLADDSAVLLGTVIGSAIGLVSHLVFGALSDAWGRKAVFLIGAGFTIAFGFPLFFLVNSGEVVLIVAAVVLALVFSHDPIFAVESSWFSELFPANVRSSGISLGYQGASVVAGFIPFIATALGTAFGWVGPASLFVLLGVISVGAASVTRETAPIRLTAVPAETSSRV